MSNTGKMTFSSNELVAIHSALEAQLEDVKKLLADHDLTIDERVQLSKVIQYSSSAIERLNIIFKENNINPNRNSD